MENGKKLAGSSSSSSFTNDLFGSNDSSSYSGVFSSIFAPPSKFTRRDGYGHDSETVDKKRDDLTGRPDKAKEGDESKSSRNKILDSIFEGERGPAHQPCNLSSSIYYGGQDMYFSPSGTQSSSSSYNKGVEDDDPHSASRGDWWQGSVYY
ncbi:hypothetical protein V2J09_009415 [Rumex salicifolius]